MIKKIVSTLLILVIILSLTGCGQSKMAKECDNAIAEIGTVSLNSIDKIKIAEKLYAELTDAEKESLKNRKLLFDAREAYDALEEAELKALLEERQPIYDIAGDLLVTASGLLTADKGSVEIEQFWVYNVLDSYMFAYRINYTDRYGNSTSGTFGTKLLYDENISIVKRLIGVSVMKGMLGDGFNSDEFSTYNTDAITKGEEWHTAPLQEYYNNNCY